MTDNEEWLDEVQENLKYEPPYPINLSEEHLLELNKKKLPHFPEVDVKPDPLVAGMFRELKMVEDAVEKKRNLSEPPDDVA